MNPKDLSKTIDREATKRYPTWHSDNREFILHILPFLALTDELHRLVLWGYGLHEPGAKSWEIESDGETLVRDKSILGRLRMKHPAGTIHDMLNRLPEHRTPDGKVWSWSEANRVYRELLIAFAYLKARAWIRWLGVTLSVWHWWRD